MEKLGALTESYKKRSKEDLAEAKLLLRSHHYVGAVSRAYYSCLHTMHFLLAKKGIQTKTHKQTHSEFRKVFVKEGPFGKEESKLVSALFKLRQNSDYDPFFEAQPEEIEFLIEKTETFLQKATAL